MALALACMWPHDEVRAQQAMDAKALVTIGGEADERLRLRQLFGDSGGSLGYLLRSTSSLTRAPAGSGGYRLRYAFLMPELRVVENSRLPFSLNEASLWAGRGWNEAVTAGVDASIGPLRVIVAPTFVHEENREFQVIQYPDVSTRSPWANPFHPLPESIDMPLRFGDASRHRVTAGQSSATLSWHELSGGFGTENRWWGPGIRNAILLSNNAQGFPSAFVRTRRPLRTPAGEFGGEWFVGRLRESRYFDRDTSNDRRALIGLAVTWSPRADSGLTVGAGRLVMRAHPEWSSPVELPFEIFHTVGHANTDTSGALPTVGRDQITSFFGRWVFPTAGFEAYAEWARFEEPLSIRDYLEFPAHSEGYTIGGQWARPAWSGRLRLQTELTYLEPDPSLRVRPVAETYTSRGVPQGFTNRGEVLGPAIGPGASSQWLAGDLFASLWRAGVYLGRIRWDNATLFEPIVPDAKRQDVTLFAGVRSSVSWKGTRLSLDFAHAARFDYLFQAYIFPGFNNLGGVDVLNNTLSVTLTTAVPR